MRKIYLHNTPLDEAIKIWDQKMDFQNVIPLEGEAIDVRDSLGRVTAEAVFAITSSPFYHSSAMDGYAVKYIDTFGASETSPKRLRIGSDAVYVNTGEPIPDGFNAVIMIEDVNMIDEFIEIIEPATPWQHVRVTGEDIVSTELILPVNHRIRSIDIGAMLSGGNTVVSVRKRPRVVIIPTGSELIEPGDVLKKGKIIEYNSAILSGLVNEWGGKPIRLKPVPDNHENIKQAIMEGCDKGDIVVVNAGSSAGTADYTADVVKEIGEIIIHGVNIKPGKPVILGWIKNKPVIGIPGYPVSAYITFNIFVKRIVYRMLGLNLFDNEYINAKLSRQVASSLGQEEFLRVKLGMVKDTLIATPVSRGAGILMSLVRADGFVRIPAMSEGLAAGAEVRVEMLRDKSDIENTVVCIGSHDNTLDLLANILKKKFPAFSLSSAHVGSMAGLMAIKKNEAHMAGIHLLDEDTGEYNVAYIKRLLPDRKIVLINLVYREQGFIVLKGNPKGINDFRDLIRNDVVFINRQRGAGTRLLTDKHLKEMNISPESIRGYEREEYTHMGVASAVMTGIADTGMGILAAANALGLDFIPVAKERYDIVIPKEYIDDDGIRAILDIIQNNQEFRQAVMKLGGYDISDMGKIIYES